MDTSERRRQVVIDRILYGNTFAFFTKGLTRFGVNVRLWDSTDLGALAHELAADGKVTLEFAECIGACEGAPCVLIDDEARMNITPEKVDSLLSELRS